jgi:hypothetical protein
MENLEKIINRINIWLGQKSNLFIEGNSLYISNNTPYIRSIIEKRCSEKNFNKQNIPTNKIIVNQWTNINDMLFSNNSVFNFSICNSWNEFNCLSNCSCLEELAMKMDLLGI